MKILVIMKRFGANKDMVMQDFGRQIRLFEPLAKKHKIDFFCPDYIKKESKVINRKGLRFIIKPLKISLLFKFLKSLKDLIRREKYDIIVATTEPLIGIIGYFYSKKFKIPLLYDLQDNFEVYDSYKIPFVGYLDRKAVKNAVIVLTVSESLKKYISRFREKPIYVIQNGIDLKSFKKTDKNKARKKLNLPLRAKIIIYIGEISKHKGANTMLEAFEKVRKQMPDAHLLLSGKIKDINIKKRNIIFEELPKREEVVTALNAADVALLPNAENNFSKYCFPYKFLEYMAINLPIVATSIGDVKILLSKYKNSLCMPNNSDDMADKLIMQLKNKKKHSYKNYLNALSWENLAKKLDNIIATSKK